MATVNDLFEQAMRLSDAERRELADQLWASALPDEDAGEITSEELDEEWDKEIAERLARYERGETVGLDAFDAVEEGRRQLRARRQP